ncbi:2,3-diketo-5-methylthio-1-phosphopentane phosphatase [Acetobacteraceae bacterium AT-5844]|nr:2,3-diketo-5-methylthio-1-phosphopentane phosphatase [Acetobacteraceae bacterium AT-5844]
MAPVSAILTDIEGTTSSIAFVKDTLFPFAKAALEDFLATHAHDPEVQACLTEARRLAAPDEEAPAALRRWMEEDAKVTPMKALQGLIWRQGYLDGRIEGHLWPDVAPCLRAWARAGIGLHVYSSGSVAAQKLLFGHSVAGDLASLFTGFFDTNVGGKREAASYSAIARGLHLAPESILFLSDVEQELDAAGTAGLQTCQLVRTADGTQPSARHRQAADFPGVASLFGLPLPRAAAESSAA